MSNRDQKPGPQAPIIIIKKKINHAGHHGGAWKVAYADFVTAMMALFIVLWLMSSDDAVKKAVGGYFVDPAGSGKLMGTTLAGSGSGTAIGVDDMEKLKDKLEQAMKQMPRFEQIKDQVQLIVTGEGLRVELLETADGMFFESGKPNPSDRGRELLQMLSNQLGKLPNRLLIEGHTDAKPYASDTYSNWELSADRANTARRLMQDGGIRSDQVAQVRGYADQQLRKSEDPESPGNRRVSVIVQYQFLSKPKPANAEKTSAGTPPPAPGEAKQGSAANH